LNVDESSFWSNLSEEIVRIILHFIYGQCLPDNLSMCAAKECVRVVGNIPELKGLVEACHKFLRNKPLMNREKKCHLGAIQIISDTFLAYFRTPLPPVSFGDTGSDPPPLV